MYNCPRAARPKQQKANEKVNIFHYPIYYISLGETRQVQTFLLRNEQIPFEFLDSYPTITWRPLFLPLGYSVPLLNQSRKRMYCSFPTDSMIKNIFFLSNSDEKNTVEVNLRGEIKPNKWAIKQLHEWKSRNWYPQGKKNRQQF